MHNAGNRKGPYSRETAAMNHLYYSRDGGDRWSNTTIPIDTWCRANEKVRLALEDQFFPFPLPPKIEEPVAKKVEIKKPMATEAEIRSKGRDLGAAFAALFSVKPGSTSGTAMQLGWSFAKMSSYQGDDQMAFALGFASVFDNHIASTQLLATVVE